MGYETLKYDFSNLRNAIDCLPDCNCNRKLALADIQSELNLFFKDFRCTEAIYTENTDNDFFGIQILPMFKNPDDVTLIFSPDSNIKFDHYLLEFDSRLFGGNFTVDQILALLIHDINKLNSSTLLKEIMFMIDCISHQKGIALQADNIVEANKIFFLFAVQDTARKMTSAFEFIPGELSLADDFIRSYELDEPYEDGMDGVRASRNNLRDQINSVSITMNWFIEKCNLYPYRYLDTIDTFKESIKFTGSKLVRRMFTNIINAFSFVDPNERAYYQAVTESSKKKMSLANQIKYGGLKSLEDDVYEYRMRIKNIETEDEAIYVIRQINNRMGLISDYLENEDLSETDKERFYKLYDKYDKLRDDLSKSTVYNRKMYGLFVDYNALQQMTASNNMTMNTYY